MIKDTLKALGDAARDTLRGWRGLLLLAALYALLLACVYYFFSTGVANAWQLALTAATALAAPVLLLLLLSATANAALPRGEARGGLLRRTLRDVPKVLLLALPVAGLAVLFVYLLGKLPGWLPKVDELPAAYVPAAGAARPVPLHWQEVLTSTLWLALPGFVLPLAAAHLWLAAARDGLKATLRGLHRVAGRAFLPRSVLVYALGLFFFGLTPYFVLFTRTSVTNGWSELSLFGLRLALTFALTLVGWVVTLGALARVTPPLSATFAPAAEPAPAAPPPEPVAAEPQLQA
ncbi:MAG TPA: hypothetical protein VF736_21705 [Pyrinomonadaceae bacterium]|jgi:hypothetical protein